MSYNPRQYPWEGRQVFAPLPPHSMLKSTYRPQSQHIVYHNVQKYFNIDMRERGGQTSCVAT